MTTEEHFDIVDESGVPTGVRRPRSVVHAEGLLHRAVHIWLLAPATGELLLQRRAAVKDSWPDRWDISCAGHLSAGDEYLGAAQRELLEVRLCVGRGTLTLDLSRMTAWPYGDSSPSATLLPSLSLFIQELGLAVPAERFRYLFTHFEDLSSVQKGAHRTSGTAAGRAGEGSPQMWASSHDFLHALRAQAGHSSTASSTLCTCWS
jgi:hypothetical protein